MSTLPSGVRTFLIRGFDPYNDAIDYGRELIPRVRERVRAREAERHQLTSRGSGPRSPSSHAAATDQT